MQMIFNRLLETLEDARMKKAEVINLLNGEAYDEKTGKISPAIVKNATKNMRIMQEEIFGPLLPIIEYDNLNEAIQIAKKNPDPLAMYIFTTNKKTEELILKSIKAGGVSINETIMHITNEKLPFGGVCTSGIGKYHGKVGFLAFSNIKSILKKQKN